MIQVDDVKLYSIMELSKTLNLTPLTIRIYLKKGKLKGKKIGKNWYLSDDMLKNYLTGEDKPKVYNTRYISIKGIIEDSPVTDKDIKEAKNIWK